jgi:Putative metal-binding motif
LPSARWRWYVSNMATHPYLPMFLVLGALNTGCDDKDDAEEDVDSGNVSDNSGWYSDSGGSESDGGGDEETSDNSGWYGDADDDGYKSKEDCNDKDPAVNPGAVEVCDNSIDDDCDGLTDAKDTDDCPPDKGDSGSSDSGSADGGSSDGGSARRSLRPESTGLDWSRLAWCAPEQTPAGMRRYRRTGSPFVVKSAAT